MKIKKKTRKITSIPAPVRTPIIELNWLALAHLVDQALFKLINLKLIAKLLCVNMHNASFSVLPFLILLYLMWSSLYNCSHAYVS